MDVVDESEALQRFFEGKISLSIDIIKATYVWFNTELCHLTQMIRLVDFRTILCWWIIIFNDKNQMKVSSWVKPRCGLV